MARTCRSESMPTNENVDELWDVHTVQCIDKKLAGPSIDGTEMSWGNHANARVWSLNPTLCNKL